MQGIYLGWDDTNTPPQEGAKTHAMIHVHGSEGTCVINQGVLDLEILLIMKRIDLRPQLCIRKVDERHTLVCSLMIIPPGHDNPTRGHVDKNAPT